MKRKDFLVGGIPLLASLAITTDKLLPEKFHSGSLIPVKIGTTDQAEDYWPIFVQVAAELGVKIISRNFSTYQQLNTALVEKQIDANIFQHIRYLAEYIAKTGNWLYPVGSTSVEPLTLYSRRYHSIAEIPRGAKIIIPNDVTNQGRALRLLESAHLVILKGNPFNPRPADIAPQSRVGVITVDAAQTARQIEGNAASVVNGNYAAKAKLNPREVIFRDKPSEELLIPYANCLVCRPQDQDREAFKTIIKARHDPRVVAAVAKSTNNTSIDVQFSPEEMTPVLDDLVRKIKNNQ